MQPCNYASSMGLRAGMRDTVLDILAGTTHANSYTVFDKKYAMLKDLQLQPVVEFFNKNWLESSMIGRHVTRMTTSLSVS